VPLRNYTLTPPRQPTSTVACVMLTLCDNLQIDQLSSSHDRSTINIVRLIDYDKLHRGLVSHAVDQPLTLNVSLRQQIQFLK